MGGGQTHLPTVLGCRSPQVISALEIRWSFVFSAAVSALCRPTLLACFLLVIASPAAQAGGPRYIAGTSFFQNGVSGTPIRWFGSSVSYYTDLGDLSPILPHGDADALVADAFARWTSVDTAALTATRSGSLDEDVNGSNVGRVGGILTLPADVQADAAKPLAVIYDADGAVTEALLGTGASAPGLCDQNAVYGAVDSFGVDASIVHAYIVLNGRCAQSSSDVAPLRYRLVRVLGQVLGLDWSQLNDTVTAGGASSEDVAGFPVMHPVPALCGWGTTCVADADQLRMDDRAAISRLYPVTGDNLAEFPGKKIFAEETANVHGEVHFSTGRGMQGVNVVARLLDIDGQPSRAVAASSVSGFRFRGNWGNPVTGYTDDSGERWDRFGAEDPQWEGYYDLSGLEIPQGSSSATYQLQVEAVNPAYVGRMGVGPYRLRQVAVSGAAGPVTVTVTRGSNTVQDIFLENSAEQSGRSASHDFSVPGTLPNGGVWLGTLAVPGEADYFHFSGREDRVATFEIEALGENGQGSEQKALPVLGIWNGTAAEGSAPSVSASYFNASPVGLSQLKAMVTATGQFTFGVADFGGDGRPDFHYRGRVFYADTIEPHHASTAGGTVLTIRGMGFVPGMAVTIGGVSTPIQSFTSEEIKVVAPPHADGVANIELADPATNAQAQMLNALGYGATAPDTITLVSAANPQVPVGTEAPYPISVRVAGSDGEPIEGASVKFTSGSSVLLLPCASTSCTQATNPAGVASVNVLVESAGAATITATVACGASVSATVNGISPTIAIAAIPPTIYMAQSSSGPVLLETRVVQNGAAADGKTVDFSILRGNGTLSAASVTTDSFGNASSTLTVTNIASQITVGACVRSTSACATFNVFPVSQTGLVLQKFSGDQQYAAPGSAFAPIVVRVLDSSTPGNPVAGMPVVFQVTALRMQEVGSQTLDGEVLNGRFPGAVVVSSGQTTVLSNPQGLATLITAAPANEPALEIYVQASAGSISESFTLHSWSGASLAQTLANLSSDASGAAAPSQTQPALAGTITFASRESALLGPASLLAVPEMANTAFSSLESPDTTGTAAQSPRLAGTTESTTTVRAAGAPEGQPGLTIEALSENIADTDGTRTAIRLTVRVLRNGEPVAGQSIGFQTAGAAGLSATSARTHPDGTASVVLKTAGLMTANLRVSACLLPDFSPCAIVPISRAEAGISSSGTKQPSKEKARPLATAFGLAASRQRSP